MTKAPPRPCRKPGCNRLSRDGSGFCDQHQDQIRKRWDDNRKSALERGYDSKWQKVRKAKISQAPLCEKCTAAGQVTPGQVVHHIDGDQFNNSMDNLQTLCRDCHEQIHGRKKPKGCSIDGLPTDVSHPWNQ